MFIPCLGTHSIKFGSAGFSDLAMAEKVLPPSSGQSRPWPCAGPRAERESWQSLEAHVHHISFHEEADLKKEYFDFSLNKTLLQQGEGYVGRTMPPQTQSTAQPSSEPAGSSGPQLCRNYHRNDTTVVQVLRMISSLLKQFGDPLCSV